MPLKANPATVAQRGARDDDRATKRIVPENTEVARRLQGRRLGDVVIVGGQETGPGLRAYLDRMAREGR
jgi:hypothetical protein